MKTTQIKEVVKSAMSQALGESYYSVGDGNISPIEAYNVVDVGKDILDVTHTADAFTGALADMVGKIVIDSREYVGSMPWIYVDSLEWGAYLERVRADLADIYDDPKWGLENGKSYADIEHTFYQPKIKAKMYTDAKSRSVRISITQDQIRTAFLSEQQMASFVTAIEVQIRNTLKLAYECTVYIAINAMIARTCKILGHEVPLLTNYNTAHNTQLSVDEALDDSDFLTYVAKTISTYRDWFADMTTAFNDGTIPSFCSKDDSRLVLLSNLEKAIKFDVKASTFNDDLIGVGEFETVSKWQAFKQSAKDDFSFETISQIKISADADNTLGLGTAEVTINNVVGVLFDRMACGVTQFDAGVTKSYTASADFMTFFHHRLDRYIVDSSYSSVVFTLN